MGNGGGTLAGVGFSAVAPARHRGRRPQARGRSLAGSAQGNAQGNAQGSFRRGFFCLVRFLLAVGSVRNVRWPLDPTAGEMEGSRPLTF